VTILFILLGFLTVCRSEEPIPNDAPRPFITVPRTELRPAITAQLNDPAWIHAAKLPELTPSLGARAIPSPLPETTFMLLWDPDYLYVRFICKDRNIYAPIHGHDGPLYRGDAVEVFLDPDGDAKRWVELEFSPDNDVREGLFLCPSPTKIDSSLCLTKSAIAHDLKQILSWDLPGLRSRAVRFSAPGEENWIVDAAIPAKGIFRKTAQNRFRPMILKGELMRYKWMTVGPGRPRELLPLNWSPVSFGNPHHSPAAYGRIILNGS
jgi:Carbohydrate family 9 binding domain-like